MILMALVQDPWCGIWALDLASWPHKDYSNCPVGHSSYTCLHFPFLNRIAGRRRAFLNTQLIATLKIASLIISPGIISFPSYGSKQGTLENVNHLIPLTICCTLPGTDGWRSKQPKQLWRPHRGQSWTKPWSQPGHLGATPLQSFLGVRLSALSSRCGPPLSPFPDQHSSPSLLLSSLPS